MEYRKRRPKGIMCHMGSLTIKGSLVCSDPCYKSGTWCSYTIEEGVDGEWECYTTFTRSKKWGQHCVVLSLVRKGYEVKQASKKLLYNEIGVDSGTCGFFNKEYYDKYHNEKLDEIWYEKNICNNVSDYVYCHNIDNEGYWSQTSYGDGTYNLYADYEGKKVIRLSVLYEWVNPEIINVVEGEDKVIFPSNYYSNYALIYTYIKKFGEKYNSPYMPLEAFDDVYSINLKEPIRFKLHTCFVKIVQLMNSKYGGGIEIYYKYLDEDSTYPFPLEFWSISKKIQSKICKGIENQFNIDRKSFFEKWMQEK